MSFEFTNLIERYAKEQPNIMITRETRQISGPRVVETTEDYLVSDCAIFNPDPDDVKYYSGLQYVDQGLKLYAPEDLTAVRQSDGQEINFKLEKNDKFEWKNDKFEISQAMDRTTHSDFIMYLAIKVVVE